VFASCLLVSDQYFYRKTEIITLFFRLVTTASFVWIVFDLVLMFFIL